MKSITIRDLRHRWPEAEAALELESEILVTRDARPVAKLVRVESPGQGRPRWDAHEHARWQKKHGVARGWRSEESLADARADRPLIRSRNK